MRANPFAVGDTEMLLELVSELDTPEHDDEDRQLLVKVFGSLALLADDAAQSAEHLAGAERVADAMRDSPTRALAYFVVTEVGLRTGNPEIAVRCAPKVTAEGMASQGRLDLYEDARDYLAQAQAGLRDPALSAALDAVGEVLRVDPDLGVPFSDNEMRDALTAQTDAATE